MSRVPKVEGAGLSGADLPDLPVITGPTLGPKRYGPEHYLCVLCQALEILPNLRAMRERRLKEDGPVPVRFEWRD